MEREDDEYIDEEDEAETGMIDRQKGRRLTNGCSTVSLADDFVKTGTWYTPLEVF